MMPVVVTTCGQISEGTLSQMIYKKINEMANLQVKEVLGQKEAD